MSLCLRKTGYWISASQKSIITHGSNTLKAQNIDWSMNSFNYLSMHVFSLHTHSPTEFPHSTSITSPLMNGFLPVLGQRAAEFQPFQLPLPVHTAGTHGWCWKTGFTLFYLHQCCLQILFLQQVEADCSPGLSVWFLPVRESVAGAWGISNGSLEKLGSQGLWWNWKNITLISYSLLNKIQVCRGDKMYFCFTAFRDFLVSLLRTALVLTNFLPSLPSSLFFCLPCLPSFLPTSLPSSLHPSWLLAFLLVFLFFFSLFIAPPVAYGQHMLGVESELQLPACATATATPVTVVTSLWPTPQLQRHWILNPLSEARDGTWVLMGFSQVLNPLSHSGYSLPPFLQGRCLTNHPCG